MATKKTLNLDWLTEALEDAASQFRGLDRNQPGQWPIIPKLTAFTAVAVAVVAVGWFLLLSPTADELEAERNRETGLRTDYRANILW